MEMLRVRRLYHDFCRLSEALLAVIGVALVQIIIYFETINLIGESSNFSYLLILLK